MIQIEEFKFNTRNELNSRERYWIEQLQAKLNKLIPTLFNGAESYNRSLIKQKDYYQKNKKKSNQYCKEYQLKKFKFYNEYLEYLQS